MINRRNMLQGMAAGVGAAFGSALLPGIVRAAASTSGHLHREITSGAGHDAVYVSQVAPTAMIFIPCQGGISHNEIEHAQPEHVAAGASVLLDAVLTRDQG